MKRPRNIKTDIIIDKREDCYEVWCYAVYSDIRKFYNRPACLSGIETVGINKCIYGEWSDSAMDNYKSYADCLEQNIYIASTLGIVKSKCDDLEMFDKINAKIISKEGHFVLTIPNDRTLIIEQQ